MNLYVASYWLASFAMLGCTIAVKAEQLNPGGSVKDRAAMYLIQDAEEKGPSVISYYSFCLGHQPF